MGSGSYKNSHRELRHSFSRSEILVNMCWPFGQHWVALLDHISVKNGFWPHVKKCFVVYIHVPGCLYMIWGHYIIGNGTSNLVLTFSNVLEPYEHPNTKISKNSYFLSKKSKNWPFFVHKKYIFWNFGVGMLVWLQYVRESQNNVRSTISYNIVVPYYVYTSTASYIYEKPLFHMWPRPFLTFMWLKRASQCWPKGQHLLTKISDLEKECLSSL